jgi:para-aminobenzoate synthetase component 1
VGELDRKGFYMIQESRRSSRPSVASSIADDWPGFAVELSPAPEACDAFRRLCHLPHCVFFDSAMADPHLGRYSFVSADPFDWMMASADDVGVWGRLKERLSRFPCSAVADLPPFQGGAAGLFSYDLSRSLERLPLPKCDEFQIPGLAIGLYDVVVAFDHVAERAWIISQGFPEVDPLLRHRRAKARARQFEQLLSSNETSEFSAGAAGSADELTSNLTRDEYLAMVGRGIEYILAGDVFQVNLAQRVMHPARDDSVSLYLRLRERNAAPFAAFFDLGEFQIVSASPERFMQLRGRRAETRPIKGTRRRGAEAEADRRESDELQGSEKDRAENVMIVDLLRNDLSKVCMPDSVVVSELCRLEKYAFVQHLVSVVEGEPRDEFGAIDLLRAAFPGGSVTGAPKVRAMEIIAELEPHARGAYCGALGYIGFDGSMDTSILIRTITAGRSWWQLPVGGGIVAQSDPRREYEETWAKAEGMIRALR